MREDLMTVTLVDAPDPRNLGWECPRCHRCYAPWVAQCKHCSPYYDGSKGAPRPAGPFPRSLGMRHAGPADLSQRTGR